MRIKRTFGPNAIVNKAADTDDLQMIEDFVCQTNFFAVFAKKITDEWLIFEKSSGIHNVGRMILQHMWHRIFDFIN